MLGAAKESMYALATEDGEPSPPGEFVSQELERDCARFLEELRRRAMRTEGMGPSSEK